jgi:hypothetical protein
MYKRNSGSGANSNRFCVYLSILITERKWRLIRYCSYTNHYQQYISNG